MATDPAVPAAKAEQSPITAALLDAGLWALITLLLTGPVVGLGTVAAAGT
jgi:hypothetical protein